MTPLLDDKKATRRSLLFLGVFSLILCWVLLFPEMIRCDDTGFHLCRINSLVLAIQNGDPMPCIFPYVYDGYGYAVCLFYSNFFLYIPASLILAGVDVLLSYKIYHVLIVIATAFSSYHCARKMMENEFSAVLTSLIYTGSSYFAIDLFVRGALGECQAFVFVPFVLLGIYNAVYGDEQDRVPLVIGYVGLVLSHNLTLLIMTILFAVFLLFNIGLLLKQPSRIWNLAKSTVLVLLLTAFFLFPMLEQLLTEEFFSTFHLAIWNPGIAAIRVRHLFWGAKMTDDPVLLPSLGITILLSLLFCVPMFFKKPETPLHRLFTLSFLGTGACLFACTSIFPWYQLDPYLNAIQFPWRLYLFITLFTAFCVGIRCCRLSERLSTRLKKWIVVLVALACAMQFSVTTYRGLEAAWAGEPYVRDAQELPIYDEMYLHANNDRAKWTDRLQYADKVTGVNGEVQTTLTRDYYHRYVTYSGNTADNALEIPAVYYRGYRAVDTDTGEELPIRPSADGWLEVGIGEKPEGSIVIDYYGTTVQHVSPYISLATVLALPAAAVIRKKAAENIRQ